MVNRGWRPHLESALCLRLPRLLKQRLLVPGCVTSGSLQWQDGYGREYGSVRYRAKLGEAAGALVLSYQVSGQAEQDTIVVSTIPNHYGGRNWFMHCPYSGRRARCLYKWDGLAGFRHREAVRPRPTYASQRDSGNERIIRQRWALRQKMGDDFSDLFSEPFRPKWMRQATFERYVARDAELGGRESRQWASVRGRMGTDL